MYGRTQTWLFVSFLAMVSVLAMGCEVSQLPVPKPSYSVTYEGNGNSGGSVPVDAGKYAEGEGVTVLENSGGLAKTGQTFVGWNTKADGTGEGVAPGSRLTIGVGDIVLYARWVGTASQDASFDAGTGLDGSVYSVIALADGKTLLSGSFDSFNGTAVSRLVRLNADGSIDSTFGPTPTLNGTIYSAAAQSDGKIVICGNFNQAGASHIARLNADGGLDTDFSPEPTGYVKTVAVQADGKIGFGGGFGTVDGVARSRIARVNADGTLDASFTPPAINNGIESLAVRDDGKIAIVGLFTGVGTTARYRAAILNSDGTLDASFDPGTVANGEVNRVVLLPGGKMLIGGNFTNGRIARLNADGSADASFAPGAGADGYVLAMIPLRDGTIVIGGNFTSYAGTPRGRIARLKADGSLDADFNPGSGFNSWVLSMAIDAGGRLIVGGDYTEYSGTARNRLVRIWP